MRACVRSCVRAKVEYIARLYEFKDLKIISQVRRGGRRGGTAEIVGTDDASITAPHEFAEALAAFFQKSPSDPQPSQIEGSCREETVKVTNSSLTAFRHISLV